MERFWKKVINNKANPLYWPVLLILWIVSVLYRIGLFIHTSLTGTPIKTGKPVISIGNLTVGGTGKTPVTLALAHQLIDSGKKIGIVSSGYGRISRDDYFGSGKEMAQLDVRTIGDEVLMMAESIPEAIFGVGKTKSVIASKLAEKYEPDIILVDDGYQHRKLKRDLNILLIDSRIDLREESLFPLGRLREPLKAINRTDLIGLTHCNDRKSVPEFYNWIKQSFSDKPLLEIEFQNSELLSDKGKKPITDLTYESVYLFAGIGNSDSFMHSMQNLFDKIVGHRILRDHCRYDSADKELILNDIGKLNPYCLVTTQKDYVKLKGFDFGRPLYYVSLHLDFIRGEEKLKQEIDSLFG